jgi:alpha-amylase/alpha-mannosidase (GH57 family)
MTIRSLCIHGHFYQPPREDPQSGSIPPEVGAAPYENWNERIHAECYRPNAERGNFERMNFNVGPTLFSWMEAHDPAAYRMIVEQDRASVRRYGVGNAIAQCYNHTIMPLATRADKETQVAWGIADFAHRFGRRPQGMWLPETAVDLETLAIMADRGIEFTILAPWQADCDGLDPTEPYRIDLPGGRSIAAFFYHQSLSGRVSFDAGLTTDADAFALHNLAGQYSGEKLARGEPQIIVVASDGELYGHHQPFRDMFLARLLETSLLSSGVEPTSLARWLREHAPRRTIAIRERTSWSCHHGVARWTDECGCVPPGARWKAALRGALDRLAAALDTAYAEALRPFAADPLALRHEYIRVLLGELPAADLIGAWAGRRLPAETVGNIHTLLEAQRERQRMWTSCGWFFEDFDRIEPKNNVAYAARAVALTRQATGTDLAPLAFDALRQVVSSRSGLRGDQVFAHQDRRARARLGDRLLAA